ncbi:MAG: hypothetical protein WBZ37_20880 [Mycobacterium sp.]
MATQEKPEPDQEAKDKAAEMMKAYEDRPTLVLPGSGKTITGTAVNDWLDEEGNAKFANDEEAPAAKTETANDEAPDGPSLEDKVAKDKAFNEEVIKAAEDRAAATK